MNTPICDFVNEYAKKRSVRLHMPGHKGSEFLGFEEKDITEIGGADSLYEACGIIKESEKNASFLFGCDTFYSTEGSSQCIRAMIYLASMHAKQQGKKPLIAAGRNAHKTFLSAAALCDADVVWLHSENGGSYLKCNVTAEDIEKSVSLNSPTAIYITSPDYLGNVLDIKAISAVCKKHGVLLLVDNAHGAYLKFLKDSLHPIDLGADICCDSAHKTLPVLTGGAYLHISNDTLSKQAKTALALFGSTSPSYLIMQSLDAANKHIADGYKEKLDSFCLKVQSLKNKLIQNGFTLCGNEPTKITLNSKPYGYCGTEIADILEKENFVCEFADKDFIVCMLTPENRDSELAALEKTLLSIPKKQSIADNPPAFALPEKVMNIREAVFSPSEIIRASESEGRILAAATVACPPAVPIVVCGEKIDKSAVKCFEYYGIEYVTVIKER
ncbi:MAG: aminotransferase class V-fold PLP-dependent enzyme [Clostridia bacterium]|nr:aminotransferase class V-fold PLP-dependent enzyme [Clostridia bacterium]